MVEEQAKSQDAVCSTRTCQDIHNLLSGCQRFGLMGAIVGDSGTGKTTAVKEYARSQNSQNQTGHKVVYFEVRKAAASMRHFLVQLHETLGGYTARESGNHEIYSRLVDELIRLKHREGLLILDETQDLDQEAKDVVRNLYEDTELGICLVGNKDLFAQKVTRGNRKAQGLTRFLGRISPRIILDKPLPEDIEALCDFYGITGKEGQKLVTKIATTGQQLHNLKNVLKVTRDAITQTGALSNDALRKAALLTGVSV
jgi:DNA transposition AAA+ family ATPase